MQTKGEVQPATLNQLNPEEVRSTDDDFHGTGANRLKEPPSSAVCQPNISFQSILARCEALKDYTGKREIATAVEFYAAIDVVQRTFAIRSSDWHAFAGEFGHDLAALAVAYMLQNGHRTRNPGGYFRRLLSLARDGKFLRRRFCWQWPTPGQKKGTSRKPCCLELIFVCAPEAKIIRNFFTDVSTCWHRLEPRKSRKKTNLG